MVTQAHKGEILSLDNQVIPISRNTVFHASFNEDLNGFNQAQKVSSHGYQNTLKFDGSSNHIIIDNPLYGQSQMTQEWTVEAWVKIPTGSSVTQILIDFNNGLGCRISNGGKPLLYLNNGANDYYVYGLTDIRDNQWHHIAFVFRNSDTFRGLYLDGVINNDGGGTNLTSIPAAMATKAYIGRRGPASESFMNSHVNDLRIWNYPRTQQQIKDSMNTEIRGDESGLVGYWKFNEGSGTIINDRSVRGNDGLLNGTATWSEGRTIATIRSEDGKFGGAVAVEEATTNLGVLSVLGLNAITYTYVGDENGYKKYSISGTWNSGSYPYSFQLASTSYTAGLSYSASCYLYTNVPQKFTSTFGGIIVVNDASMTGAQRQVRDGNYSTREDYIHSVNMTNQVYVFSRPISDGTVFDPLTDFVYIKDFQIEQKSFATSFINGSRNLGRLEYNTNLTGDFTISLHYRSVAPSGYASDKNVLSLTNGTNTFNFFNGYGLDWYMGDEVSRTRFRLTDKSVPYGYFEHLVIVRQGNIVKLYRNGVLTDTKDFGSNPKFTKISVGGGYAPQNQTPNGIFDEVKIDKVAASDAEIISWYKSNAPFYNYLDYSGKE